MGMFIIKCDHCGASLHVNDEADSVVCEYCGDKTMINKTNPNIPTPPQQYNNDYSSSNNNQQNYNVPQNNYNGYSNQNNTKKSKKKKKNGVKILLYVFFTLIIIASSVIFYVDYTKEPEEPEIYDSLPSEIQTTETQEVQVEAATIKMAPDVDLDEERRKYNNPEIIGRLEIPDLFNVLVTKTDNNKYYLSHSVKKEYDIRGTEFLDFRLTPTSKQVNIYGHNTRDEKIKVAFLKLEKFLKKDFFDENQYIIFQYDGGKSVYKILAIKEIRDTNNEHMYVDYTGQTFVEHVQKMTTGEGVNNYRDIYYDENSEIIVLQTCSHHWDNAFYTIIGVKI